jgi:endonuclease/exonuclease/phosphatase family metal-dependent hydrolase
MLVETHLNSWPYGRTNWWSRLHRRIQPAGSLLLNLPYLDLLRPPAERAVAVASPAGRIAFLPGPTRPAPEYAGALTILSANIYHDWPRLRRLPARLDALAQMAEREEADVLLLQEVARTTDFRGDEWLAGRLGMAYLYARANGDAQAIGFEEGPAVFSRYPLAHPALAELNSTPNPFTRRIGLGAELQLPGCALTVFSVHLALTPGENAAQLRALHRWVYGLVGERPALVAGDFNAHESARRIKWLRRVWLDTFRHLHPHADGATHTLGGSLSRRLDYHFLHGHDSPWRIVESRHLANPHSDHKAVLTRLACGAR